MATPRNSVERRFRVVDEGQYPLFLRRLLLKLVPFLAGPAFLRPMHRAVGQSHRHEPVPVPGFGHRLRNALPAAMHSSPECSATASEHGSRVMSRILAYRGDHPLLKSPSVPITRDLSAGRLLRPGTSRGQS